MSYCRHGYDMHDLHESHPVGINYIVRNERMKQDHTNKVPHKVMEKEQLPWGFYGYTYLGHNKMRLNTLLDQTPQLKREKDVHEAIHTPDEYETRVVSRDMVKEEPREDIIKRVNQQYQYN